MKITNIWGEASGKLGAMVFSRNKGGAYVRKFVTPTNPSTQKQRAVRERFSQRATEFRSLPQETKAMWQEYLQTYYNPLTGTGKGNALNAFVSNRQAVDNAINIAQQTSFDTGVSPAAPFVLPTEPPTLPIAANIHYEQYKIVPFIDNVLYANGVMQAQIMLPGLADVTNFELVNENYVRVALNVYVSSPSGGEYFSNPYRHLVASTAGYAFNELNGGRLGMAGPVTLQSKSNYRATLVIMDMFGQQMPISTFDFTVPPQP